MTTGDLFYLEVTTLENKTFFITASARGFFVNQSTATTFNPTSADRPPISHSLVGVLREISAAFAKNFPQVLQWNYDRHPFEVFRIKNNLYLVALICTLLSLLVQFVSPCAYVLFAEYGAALPSDPVDLAGEEAHVRPGPRGRPAAGPRVL
jgi:hypothetical protein